MNVRLKSFKGPFTFKTVLDLFILILKYFVELVRPNDRPFVDRCNDRILSSRSSDLGLISKRFKVGGQEKVDGLS